MENPLVERQSQEVALSSKVRMKDMWEAFKETKSRNGTFVAFGDYRQSLGGRGIWGTKIFFRALEEIGFIIECDEDNTSNGRYCPSELAMDKYPDLFRYDDEAKIWGLSQQHLDVFDEKIFPHLIVTARKLEAIYKEEKKAKQKAIYALRKAQDKANISVTGGSLI